MNPNTRPLTRAVLLLTVGLTCGLPLRAEEHHVVYPDHSGVWYDPSRSGEGFVLEIISETAATLAWFTYDEAGNQRWLVALGAIAETQGGRFLEFPEIYDTHGGVFGDTFDPDLVVRRPVGSARIQFVDCENGRLLYEAYETSGSVPIARIAETMGTSCSPPHGRADARIEAYAGQSGGWYDPAHSGEGFQLQWSTDGDALLTWYTYDSAGRQYWLTGVGTRHDDGTIHFPSLVSTRGARFGDAFDPGDVERFHWGTLTLDIDCDRGVAHYQSGFAAFGAGEQQVVKLTSLAGVPCPWTPRRLTDVYELEVMPVPTVLVERPLPQSVQVFSIADDGTLLGATAASGRFRAWRLAPGGGEWELLGNEDLAAIPFQISSDGERILVNQYARLESSYFPLLQESGIWAPLRATFLEQSSASGGSQQLTHVVGTGRMVGDVSSRPWIWNAQSGQRELPMADNLLFPSPLAVSEDGRTVIGIDLQPRVGRSPILRGIAWRDLASPELLRDAAGAVLGPATACSTNCGIIHGQGHSVTSLEHPEGNQPWVRFEDGDVRYLGHLPLAFLDSGGTPYAAKAATADGSMVVGSYATARENGELGTEAYLWTSFTGLVSLRDVSADLGKVVADWQDVYGMDVSSDGSFVLLTGVEGSGGASPVVFRSVVLHLIRTGQTHLEEVPE